MSPSESEGEGESEVEVEVKVINPPKTDAKPLQSACIPMKGTNYVVPPGARELADRENQLLRYLMEIMAFALDVNFDELNSALYKQPIISNTKRILTDEEREGLLHLSRLVQ
jgi:hypothetical protein